MKLFKDDEKPERWVVRELFPSDPDQAVVEHVAEFLEFSPISDIGDIPNDDPWQLTEYEVSDMLCSSKNASRVQGDIFPDLINPNSDILAIPLADIFNTMIAARKLESRNCGSHTKNTKAYLYTALSSSRK